jgi:hypothetical protein
MTTSTNIESTNWSGAVITAPSGKSFSTVSAEWVVPTVTQVPIKGVTTSDVAEWVGIDGYNSADVCQAGILEIVQTSANGQTTITCEAFVEWYPAAAEIIAPSNFDVSPGNEIEVTVETSGAGATTATVIFDDITTGQIDDVTLTAPSGTSLKGNSAEFVVETPELISGKQVSQPLLTDFLNSPVVFHDVSATYKGGAAASLSSAQSIGVYSDEVPGSHGYVQEAYGSIQPASDSVTVTEDDYWPAPSAGRVAGVAGVEGGVDGSTFLAGNGAQALIEASGHTLTGDQGSDSFVFPPNLGNETIANFVGIEGAAGKGAPVLIGGPGDTLTGDQGSDTFVFPANLGHEAITNSNAHQDAIDLAHAELANFADALADAHQVGANFDIGYHANDVITSSNVALLQLHASNFHLV